MIHSWVPRRTTKKLLRSFRVVARREFGVEDPCAERDREAGKIGREHESLRISQPDNRRMTESIGEEKCR